LGIKVPLDQLLLARSLAPAGSHIPELVDLALREARDKHMSPGIAALVALAREQTGTVLPFRVDDIDLDVAAILMKDRRKGLVYSSISRVEAGYAIVDKRSCSYIDRHHLTGSMPDVDFRLIPHRRVAGEELSPAIRDFSPVAHGIVGSSPKIVLTWESDATPSIAGVQWNLPMFQVIDPDSRDRDFFLRDLVVDSTTDHSVTITIQSPESMNRLNTATGRVWIAVNKEVRAVFPLPSFEHAAQGVPAWMQVELPEGWATVNYGGDVVEVSEELAVACLKAFRWFIFPDPGRIVRMLAQQPDFLRDT